MTRNHAQWHQARGRPDGSAVGTEWTAPDVEIATRPGRSIFRRDERVHPEASIRSFSAISVLELEASMERTKETPGLLAQKHIKAALRIQTLACKGGIISMQCSFMPRDVQWR